MFLAHSIRLRDPWQCDRVGDGALRWSRVFHRPTGIEADDLLWLMVVALPAEVPVAVNGAAVEPVYEGLHARFDVTHLLGDANRVEFIVPDGGAAAEVPAAFPYDVRLAIVGQS